ncbi:MAG: hypothetical protein WCH78_10215 [Bacteroidota bacterium]
MKRIFFFAVLILLLYNIIGCTKQSNGPPPVPSIYRADDYTTGIFNYAGIAYDTVSVIDSIYPPLPAFSQDFPSGFHATTKTYAHQVSGQIRIRKLVSDSTIIHFTSPLRDNFDSITIGSGLIFQTCCSYWDPSISGYDTIIKASYSNNKMTLTFAGAVFEDAYRGYFGFENWDGRFINGQWEINYQTHAKYRGITIANPIPGRYFVYGYHTYHLICVKQH